MLRNRLAAWYRPFVYLGHNPLTLAGAILTTSSAFTLVGFWIVELAQGHRVHPYTGIIFFLILPGIFVFGLVLIPLGIWLRWTKLRKVGELPQSYPTVDLAQPGLRRGAPCSGA